MPMTVHRATDESRVPVRSTLVTVTTTRLAPTMTAPTHSGRNLFVTLPVADVARSTEFFAGLGFQFDPAFGDASTACMLVGEQATVMLGARERFEELSPLRPATRPTTPSRSSRSPSAHARRSTRGRHGGNRGWRPRGARGRGPRLHVRRAFYDLDGHGWQVMWFDPAAQAAEPAPAAG